MSLIVETGAGLSDAESYLSVADADAYLAKYGTPAAWSALSTGNKEIALRKATQFLENVYGTKWYNRRNSLAQNLSWPRTYMIDKDGFGINSNVIPQGVKDATAELAVKSLTDDLEPDIDAADATVVSESVTVGPVSESKTYQGTKGQIKRYMKVWRMIKEFLQSNNDIQRA